MTRGQRSFTRYLVAGALLVSACTTAFTNGTALTPDMACWVQSAANAAGSAFLQANGGASNTGSIAASALSTAAGYGCTSGQPAAK